MLIWIPGLKQSRHMQLHADMQLFQNMYWQTDTYVVKPNFSRTALLHCSDFTILIISYQVWICCTTKCQDQWSCRCRSDLACYCGGTSRQKRRILWSFWWIQCDAQILWLVVSLFQVVVGHLLPDTKTVFHTQKFCHEWPACCLGCSAQFVVRGLQVRSKFVQCVNICLEAA